MLNKFLEKLLNCKTWFLWIMSTILLVIYEIIKTSLPVDAFIVLFFAYALIIVLFIKIVWESINDCLVAIIEQIINKNKFDKN